MSSESPGKSISKKPSKTVRRKATDQTYLSLETLLMIEQQASSNGAADNGQGILYMKRALFGDVADLIRTNPKSATVMLNLLAMVYSDGVVETTLAVVADQCDMTLKDVGVAIAHLSSAGLICSVEASIEPGGPFTCLVSPGLTTADKPEVCV